MCPERAVKPSKGQIMEIFIFHLLYVCFCYLLPPYGFLILQNSFSEVLRPREMIFGGCGALFHSNLVFSEAKNSQKQLNLSVRRPSAGLKKTVKYEKI